MATSEHEATRRMPTLPASSLPAAPSKSAAKSAASAEGLLARIAGIAAVLEQAGAANEALGRLTPEVVACLHEARLFRLLLPRAYDGEEVDLATWFRVMEALARCDSSTAWCVGQINGCAATASALAPAVARTIWGAPHAALSWGPPVAAQATAVDGGHLLSGEWGMASGSRHATWIGLMAPITDDTGHSLHGDPSELNTFLVPASAVTFIDNWQVHGLVATNSGGYSVNGLFVPEGYAVNRQGILAARIDTPLYRFPLNSMFALGFSAVALGTARALLDAAVALATQKTPRGARHALADSPIVQLAIGEAEARLRSARGYVAATAERVWQETVASGVLQVAQRLDIRMAATFAIHEAKTVAEAAWETAGASAIFRSSAFERRMRDIRTLTQQLQGRRSHLQDTGAFLLGRAPNLMFA
jgi:alkylation response protein AidB-like acyl-CoA dehydrogenase